jgi:hypothetical protein
MVTKQRETTAYILVNGSFLVCRRTERICMCVYNLYSFDLKHLDYYIFMLQK